MITNDDIGWLKARWPTATAIVLLLVTLALLDATQLGTSQTDSIVQPWVALAAGLVYPIVGLGRRVLRDGRTVLVQSLGSSPLPASPFSAMRPARSSPTSWPQA